MTDQEINEAVAKRLHPNPQDMDPLNPPSWVLPHKIRMPDYCHSIGAAWEIMEYCSEKLLLYDVAIYYSRTGSCWYCKLGKKDRYNESIAADTAPMAICLAFLGVK